MSPHADIPTASPGPNRGLFSELAGTDEQDGMLVKPALTNAPTELLARAANLAKGDLADVSDDELLSAAGDLVEWGMHAEAHNLIGMLEQRGAHLKATARLRRIVKFASDPGPAFEPVFLSAALKTAKDPKATSRALMLAADSLLKWGALDAADAAIARLETMPDTAGAPALKAASRQLRRSGLLSTFSAVGHAELSGLNQPHEAVLARVSEGSDRLIIAFPGADGKFWLSLHVLYHFLKPYRAHILYLNDHSGSMFLNGLSTVAPGYPALVDLLRTHIRDLGVSRTHVMALSAGGFVGLRAAADIHAEGYLGLGIRTDMSRASRLSLSKYGSWAMDRCSDEAMLINLRPYIEKHAYPKSIQLISADGARHDIAHAENLRGVDRVRIAYLEKFRDHNVMPGLIARGLLQGVLDGFLGKPGTHDG
jgi:hypothetical protein